MDTPLLQSQKRHSASRVGQIAGVDSREIGAAKSLSGAKDVTERIVPAAAQFLQDSSQDAR